MRKQEFVINILLIAVSLAMVFYIIPKWTADPQEYGLSGGSLPTLLCVVIGLLAALQIFSGLVKGLRPDDGKGLTLGVVLHVVKYFVPMFCIIPLWKYCGFMIGSIIVLLALLLIAGRRDYVRIAIIAALLPAGVTILLLYGLQVPTP